MRTCPFKVIYMNWFTLLRALLFRIWKKWYHPCFVQNWSITLLTTVQTVIPKEIKWTLDIVPASNMLHLRHAKCVRGYIVFIPRPKSLGDIGMSQASLVCLSLRPLETFSCPLCNLNTVQNVLMILYSYVEQVMTMCR